jgi:hypothetical protein
VVGENWVSLHKNNKIEVEIEKTLILIIFINII